MQAKFNGFATPLKRPLCNRRYHAGMLEQQIEQHFIDSADLKYQSAQTLSKPIAQAVQAILASVTSGGKVLACGNGGSATEAQNFATQFVGRFERDRPELAAIALNADSALLTAVAHDFDFEHVFSKQVRALGQAGDVLLAISNDGNALSLMRRASVVETTNKGNWEDQKGSFRDKLKDEASVISMEQASKVVTSEEMTLRLIEESKGRHAQQPDNLDHIRAVMEGYRKLNNLTEAIVWIRKARALPNGKADVTLEKLENDMQIAQLEAEVKELEASLATTPADSALQAQLEKAKVGLAATRLADAKSYVERYPNDFEGRFTLANLYFGLKDYGNASANYQQALKSPKVRVPSLIGMGKALKARKMFDLAVAQLQNAKTETTNMDDTKKDAIYELADCYEKMGKKEEAMAEYKILYGEDMGYRDVSAKIEAFYAGG